MKRKWIAVLLLMVTLCTALASCTKEHTHEYADTWSTSSRMHWKDATCGHEVYADGGEHDFGTEEAEIGATCKVCGYVKKEGISVAEAVLDVAAGETVLVEGLFAGVADEGAGYQKELILKDTASDQLIAVQGVTYGTFPEYGYEKGDLVRLYGTVVRERYDAEDSKSENKTYLTFSDRNPESAEQTIVSRGNRVIYRLNNVVTLQNWIEMKDFFKANTLEAYTYVRIKGSVWFNSYCNTSDGVPLHRLSMNPAATSLTAIKPDGARAIGIRQNTLSANVPAAMTAFFDECLGDAKYPGQKMTDTDFYAVVTATNSVNFQLTILDASWLCGMEEPIEIKTQQDIVKEVGFSYYRQGAQIYYDQRWRDENPVPELATAQQQLFLDCSSYVNAVYYEAFGVNIQGVSVAERSPQTGNYSNYAKSNLGKSPDVVGYWETANYKTISEQVALLEQVYAMLQVGDVLVWRRGENGATSGHAMLYVGDGLFLHSTGSQATGDSTDPTGNKDIGDSMGITYGTVQKLSADAVFTDMTNSRYIFRSSSNKVHNFCVLRPLALGLTATQKTENRMKIAGLSMEKRVEPGLRASVARGEEITYTLRIENHSSNAYTGVVFEDILSDQLIFTGGSSKIAANGQKLTATLSIGPFGSVTLRWSAKVKADATVGAHIENGSTSLGGVNIAMPNNFVGAYASEQLTLVAEKAREYAAKGESFGDPLAFAEVVWRDAVGVEPFAPESAANVMDDLFVEWGTSFGLNEQSALVGMAVPNLYSGTKVHRLADIVQIHTESDFMLGDLILCEWNGHYRLLVYVGKGEFVQVDTVTGTATLVQNGPESFQYGNGSYYNNSVTSQLRTYEKCVVLRPAQVG